MACIDRRTTLTMLAGAGLAAMTPRAFAQAPAGPFRLDPLPYAAGKNEPHIDAQTMEIHHDRHHAAYVTNLNAAVAAHSNLAAMPLHDLLAKLSDVPESVRTAVRNNGGGHANHSMFWQIMGGSGGAPKGDLKAAIDRDFGSLDKLQEAFNGTGLRVFGSGWVFVTVATDGKLALTSRPNQDTPLMDGGRVLIGNDVWEHAYYLKAWWNVLDWDKIEGRYTAAKAGTLTI